MNIVKKDTDELNAIVTVQVSKQDYEEQVEKTLHDYRKKANMPGFRPGKVPAGLVKKMYGKAALVDEINKVVSDSLFKYIKDNEIAVLGDPLPNETEQKDVDFDNNEDFEFVFDLGIAPKLDFKIDKKDKVKYYDIAIDEKMVDDQVKSYTGRFGSYEDAEKVEEKDVIKGNMTEVGVDGGITVEAAVLCPNYMKDAASKKLFIGKKVGDVVKFNPKKAFETEGEVASLLKKKKEEIEGNTSDFEFAITNITRYKEAEINQELFDKALGKDAVKSEEEFRNKLKETLKETLIADSDYKFGVDAREVMLKKVKDVKFPDAFLKRWALATNKGLTQEALDKDYDAMIENLKWQLVKEKLAKENNIKIEDADLENFAKKVAQAQFAQYGMPNVPEDVLKNYVSEMLKDQKSIKGMVDGAMNEKAVAIIKDAVKLENTEISLDEFNKLSAAK